MRIKIMVVNLKEQDAKRFLLTLGAKNIKYLDEGAYCMVFSCLYKGKNLVAKVTRDKQDYLANKFFGFYRNDMPKEIQKNFPRYFYYVESTNLDLYVCFVERLRMMFDKEYHLFFDMFRNKNIPTNINVKNLKKSFNFLEKKEIEIVDVHRGNIMMRENEYVISDVGLFEIPNNLKRKYKNNMTVMLVTLDLEK